MRTGSSDSSESCVVRVEEETLSKTEKSVQNMWSRTHRCRKAVSTTRRCAKRPGSTVSSHLSFEEEALCEAAALTEGSR